MNEATRRAMVLAIVVAIDYDTYKDTYNKDTAEEPEEVEGKIQELLHIVDVHLEAAGHE